MSCSTALGLNFLVDGGEPLDADTLDKLLAYKSFACGLESLRRPLGLPNGAGRQDDNLGLIRDLSVLTTRLAEDGIAAMER